MLHFNHDELLPVDQRMRDHVRTGLPTLAEDVYRVPVSTYVNRERWELGASQSPPRRACAKLYI